MHNLQTAHMVPAQTLPNQQQNTGTAGEHGAPGWGRNKPTTGSTKLSAANSPFDLNGGLVPWQDRLSVNMPGMRKGKESYG